MKDLLQWVPVRHLFGLSIHAATLDQAVAICREAIESRGLLQIGVVNAAKVVNLRSNPSLRDSIADSNLRLADGMAVVWASRLLLQPLPERVAGIDLFHRLLDLANENGHAVYFLGARQEVIEKVLERVAVEYAGLRVAGSRNGYFTDEEEEHVADDVQKSGADILFVAMSPPKKEIFLHRWANHMSVPVCHGVGGSFDVFAGKTRRAPKIMQSLGMEWLYRVYQEPRRMWRRYLVTNSVFLYILFREIITKLLKLKRARSQ